MYIVRVEMILLEYNCPSIPHTLLRFLPFHPHLDRMIIFIAQLAFVFACGRSILRKQTRVAFPKNFFTHSELPYTGSSTPVIALQANAVNNQTQNHSSWALKARQ